MHEQNSSKLLYMKDFAIHMYKDLVCKKRSS